MDEYVPVLSRGLSPDAGGLPPICVACTVTEEAVVARLCSPEKKPAQVWLLLLCCWVLVSCGLLWCTYGLLFYCMRSEVREVMKEKDMWAAAVLILHVGSYCGLMGERKMRKKEM